MTPPSHETTPAVTEARLERAEKRLHLIKGIQANEKNQFPDAELTEMDTNGLEKLASLAKVEDYSGKGLPFVNQVDDPNAIPAPPSIFEKKTA